MPYVFKDRVKASTTTTGTGTYTIGTAATGYQNFSVIGNGNQTYYCATDGTNWEVGIGTYTASGTTLSRDQVLESSNSNNAVNWGSGSKDIFVTYPAEATEGVIPNMENSSIGTDLVAWKNYKRVLDGLLLSGKTFTNGIVSTFSTTSVSFPSSTPFRGGVMGLNGSIYFIPHYAQRGMVLNPTTGTCSTYSLIYTTGVTAYHGGVLAPNGDIHFVPQNAVRGQKVSANGVVSTYSLVYTTPTAYSGGALAPNGDIHFAPTSAARGQKISAAGVVSTYSLVYTTNQAYRGGVLAPNGNIYFSPGLAAVGQKINTATGVVSTYSLIATNGITGFSNGGVLAPDGSIYYIQAGSFSYGILFNTNTEAFSTFSLIRTGSNQEYGGVLAPNGDVYYVPAQGVTIQAITTGISAPIGVCYSSFVSKSY